MTHQHIFKIYCLIELQTGDVRYIGKTSKSLEARLSQHIRDTKYLKLTSHRLKWLNEQVNLDQIPQILELGTYLTEVDANKAEQEFIRFFRDLGCRLVNSTDGGEGVVGAKFGPHTEEFKSHMRKIMTGRKKPEGFGDKVRKRMLGYKPTSETVSKLSEYGKTRIGDKNPFFGKKHSEKTKQILSEKCSKLKPYTRTQKHLDIISKVHKGKKLTEEHKALIRLQQAHKRKKVILIETDEVYESVRAAAKANKCSSGNVSKVCRGAAKSCNGLHFKFYNEVDHADKS